MNILVGPLIRDSVDQILMLSGKLCLHTGCLQRGPTVVYCTLASTQESQVSGTRL